MRYVERLLREVDLPDLEQIYWNSRGPWIIGMLLLNDTFYYASGDAEFIPPDEIDSLVVILKERDKKEWYDGDILWAAKRRGIRPLTPLMQRWSLEQQEAYMDLENPYAVATT